MWPVVSGGCHSWWVAWLAGVGVTQQCRARDLFVASFSCCVQLLPWNTAERAIVCLWVQRGSVGVPRECGLRVVLLGSGQPLKNLLNDKKMNLFILNSDVLTMRLTYHLYYEVSRYLKSWKYMISTVNLNYILIIIWLAILFKHVVLGYRRKY